VHTVPERTFLAALMRWLDHDMPEKAMRTLVFRLDEFITGDISISNLEALVGDKGLESVIQSFEEAGMCPSWINPGGKKNMLMGE
jgi:hypothetical protein